MRPPPRGLSSAEAEVWARLAATVTPLHQVPEKPAAQVSAAVPPAPAPVPPVPAPRRVKGRVPAPVVRAAPTPATPPAPATPQGLDSHWERRLAKTGVDPDFTLDLHGHTLEQAWQRLDSGLAQARAMDARLVLVVTGRPRAEAAADRADRRGAIRAKILDWLAVGPHASAIAAVRPAHRRHGGAGALYLVLRRRR